MENFQKRYEVKVGLAPTRRNVFSREDAQKYKKIVEDKLKSWGIKFVTLNKINKEGLLSDATDVPKVVEYFRKENVDAVFAPHCNFGTEDAVAELGRQMGKPFLLWGPRDESPLPDGTRLRDTQCGLFATSKILRRFGVPFTYIVNSRIDDPVFECGFKNFVGAASVVREFRSLRIGQIAPRPLAFWTVIVNEGELLERFGIKVIPITLTEIVDAVNRKLKENKGSLKETVQDFKKRVVFAKIDEGSIKRMAALKLVLIEWAKRESLSAIAFQCWTALQDALKIYPCFVDSELTGMGIPVACETDIHGAVTSVMLQASLLGATPTFFADLTIRHPENEDSELLWHCGPFPYTLRDEEAERKPSVGKHYIPEIKYPGVAEWKIKGGDITMARFDGDRGEYSMLMGQARGTEGPFNRGTYIWVEVNDWPLWEEKIIRGPYIHHVACIHGQVSTVLYEACRYIPGLKPDPVDPTEQEILSWLRGR